jgi:hypothetical protein
MYELLSSGAGCLYVNSLLNSIYFTYLFYFDYSLA